MIKAIIFDMDDTLYEEREYVLSGFFAIDNYLNQINIDGFYKKAVRLFDRGVRGTIINDVLESMGILYSENFILFLVELYRNHIPKITLLDDAKVVIETLRPKYKLGLLTDGYIKTQQNKVKALGVDGYFDIMIYSDSFGREHWKPSPTPYLELMKKFQCEGPELIYIGDNPMKDFITAKKLDWMTVKIERETGEYKDTLISEEYKADYTINTLYELLELL
ncbi:HAD family hydrolase [Peribacillus sp. NPDC097198]|uniref:HAD family hydrolase n=1 Tax=Peribacillus sp. NPDC097198 TaxID=3364397 RepID=UPI00381BE021